MNAKPNKYADSVCCICTGEASSACAMPANAGMYVSIENGPSMPSTASKDARAKRGARQSWSASGFIEAGKSSNSFVFDRAGPDLQVLSRHRARGREPAVDVAETFDVVQILLARQQRARAHVR